MFSFTQIWVHTGAVTTVLHYISTVYMQIFHLTFKDENNPDYENKAGLRGFPVLRLKCKLSPHYFSLNQTRYCSLRL